MKRLLFTMLLLISAVVIYGQTTYYWVGGAGATSFTANSNWNTLLNGTGSTRAAAAANDILIFDGSNIGGAVPATGSVIATVTSTAFGQLRLQNGANVNIGRSSAGSATLTMNGDGSPIPDLAVDAGCTLTLGSAITNYDVNLVVTAAATASISGTVYLSPLSTTVHTRSFITASAANTVVFENGAVCHISDSFVTSGFNASVANSILFKTGSSLYYYTGRSPIGNNSTTQFTNFEPGSNLYFMQSNISYIDGTTAYGSSSWVNQKILANVFIKNGSTVRADGPVYKIENFTIDNGSAFVTHTSGNTAVLGDLIVNGTLNGPAGSSNIIVMGGNNPQNISGSGVIDVPSITIANNSNVTLAKSVSIVNAANNYGKIDFGATNQITGPGTFTSRVNATATSVTGNTVAGSYVVTGVTGTIAGVVGLQVDGNGIAPNTNIVGFSTGSATLNLSKPATSTTTGSTFIFSSDTAILTTANPNGMDSLTGSVITVGTKAFQSGTSYIINGATTWPFGVTSGSAATFIDAAFVEVNAPITVNKKVKIYNHLSVNGKINLNPLDTIHIINGAVINGSFNSSNYIATGFNGSGEQGILQYDGLASATTLPIGTVNYFMPVTINPANSSDFTATVYEGITTNGTITGTPFTPTQKQTVVNAAWNINRLTGTGNADVQLGWDELLEGSTFTTLPGTDIGLITNNGSIWATPIGTGDNTANTITATISSFGPLGAGAVPQVNPFVFNALPVKTYGDADFNGGATSLNTSQPIIYTSTNTAVATIVGNDIHITGTGTTDITASQASDGFYPAASVTRTLTVNKANLTITADNKTRFEGLANPALTATYTGFVLSETSSVLLTPVVLATTAVPASAPGTYPITVTGATAANYNITMVNGVLTVQAKQNQTITFAAPATKTYGNADFSAAASSTNNTIPLTYVSTNTGVATINSSGLIHITGAGTTNITVSQAGNDGYFAAPNVTRTLTVNKANLTIRVRDTTKVVGEVNPPFTITYTGFVLGETATNLTALPSVTTTATTASAPGYYALTLGGAASGNYNFTYTNGRLTIYPASGTAQQYMNAFMSNSSTLTVRVFSPAPALGDIVIFDFSGKPLIRRNLFMPAGFINMDIPVYHLPAGLYIVTIKGDGVDLKKTILK